MHEAVSAEVRDEENESEAEVRDQEPEAVSVEEELLSEWKRTVQGRTVSFDFVQNSIFWPTFAPGPQSPGFHRTELPHIEGDLFCIHPKLWSKEVTRLRAAAEETAALDDDQREKPLPAPAEESREIKEPEPVEEPAPDAGRCGRGPAAWSSFWMTRSAMTMPVTAWFSGLLDGWACDCEMILGEEVTPLKELPMFGRLKAGARIRLQLSSLCWNTTTPQPMAEPSEKPRSDEGSTAVPETEEDQTDGDVEIVEGLRGCGKVGGGWLELAAPTLDEYEEALKILASKLEDRTFAEHKLR